MSAFGIFLRGLLQLTQRVALTLTGYLLFFDEKIEEQMGRSAWQDPLLVCMVAGFVMVNYTNVRPSFPFLSVPISSNRGVRRALLHLHRLGLASRKW